MQARAPQRHRGYGLLCESRYWYSLNPQGSYARINGRIPRPRSRLTRLSASYNLTSLSFWKSVGRRSFTHLGGCDTGRDLLLPGSMSTVMLRDDQRLGLRRTRLLLETRTQCPLIRLLKGSARRSRAIPSLPTRTSTLCSVRCGPGTHTPCTGQTSSIEPSSRSKRSPMCAPAPRTPTTCPRSSC